MKRAIRRMQRERMKRRAIKVLKLMKFPTDYAGYWADNLAKCSCHMCRNTRRDGELTKQELIFYAENLNSV